MTRYRWQSGVMARIALLCAIAVPRAMAQSAPGIQPPIWRLRDQQGAVASVKVPPVAPQLAQPVETKDAVVIDVAGSEPSLEIRVNKTVVFSEQCGADCRYAANGQIIVPLGDISAAGGLADVEIVVTIDDMKHTGYFVLQKRWEVTAMQSPVLFSLANRIGQWRLGEDITPSLSPAGIRIFSHRTGFFKYVIVGSLLQAVREDESEGIALSAGAMLDLSGFLQLALVPAQHGRRAQFLVGLRPELLRKVVPESKQ